MAEMTGCNMLAVDSKSFVPIIILANLGARVLSGSFAVKTPQSVRSPSRW